MNPVENTTGKSGGTDLHQCENRQGRLADLGPSSPGPPRAAAVAHQLHQSSNSRFFAMHLAPPGGNDTNAGQAQPRQEDPLHDLSWGHMAQALNTGVYARFECMPPPPDNLRNRDAAVPPTGLTHEHPPAGESPGSGRTTGQRGAPPFGGALEALSGGERADLRDLAVNRLMSDDYEAYDPEDSSVRALMTDYEAMLLNTGAAPLTGPARGYPPVGESPAPGRTTGQLGAPEALFGDEHADPLDFVANRLLSDDYEAYDPEDPNVLMLMTDYEATLLNTGAPPFAGEALEAPSGQASMASGGERAKRPAEPLVDPDHAREKKRARDDYMPVTSEQRQVILHVFKTDPERNIQSLADEIGVSISTIRRLRKRFSQTGNLKPGDRANRLSADQRRAILHIFKTDPERKTQSIVDEFGIGYTTMRVLRDKFRKTGNLKLGDSANRLSADQRQAVLHIFETDPARSIQSLADEFGVSLKTIQAVKRRFSKTGTIKPGDSQNRLSAEQRRALSHIFETDPARSTRSLADEFGVSITTIQTARRQFGRTGTIKPGNCANRLSAEQRRALSHIFETDPARSSQSLADEFDVNMRTIQTVRRQFDRTGTIKPGDSTKRLSAEQRRALSHIFETDPQRSLQSLAEEFGVAYSTINGLRNKFKRTGTIEPEDHAKRLSAEQRQAILHIFETDPQRNNRSIIDEFGISFSTLKRFRKKFSETGNLKPGNHARRLSAEQRQTILHIFETDPQRNNQSIADEFGVHIKTIQQSRRNVNT